MKLQYLFSLGFTLFSVLALAPSSSAQSTDDIQAEPTYEENIKKEFINNIYIPVNLDDAFQELKRLSDKVGLDKFKNAEEELVAKKLHFGLGRWIMKKWNLYDGSRYSHYLRNKGLSYPDDMARFTIVSLHRHLNGVDLEVEKRIKAVKELREKEYKEKMLEKKVIKEITKEKDKEN